jgi:hypothetical protein
MQIGRSGRASSDLGLRDQEKRSWELEGLRQLLKRERQLQQQGKGRDRHSLLDESIGGVY